MDLVVLLNQFPALSETFVVDEVAALRRLGHAVRVEAGMRAVPAAHLAEPPPVTILDEDGLSRRIADTLWLAATRPRAVAADLRDRRRWRREEEVHPLRVLAPVARRLARHGERHVHVHFADVAALDALRLRRLTGVTYSVTAHAFDIYRRPTNLREKLTGAAVAFGVCEPAVDELRRRAPEARVELHAMGVDTSRFGRAAPAPGGRQVLAIGRLVEKKGFAHLVAAAGRLRDTGRALSRLTIVGDGPERAALQAQISDLDLDGDVVLTGALDPVEIPGRLGAADVLAVPSVVAGDGDRDALPVVVLEALAMQVPVVATDVMGLPEVVRPPWGRVVAPGDPVALADALDEMLARPPSERAAAGAAGRRFVEETRSLDRQAAKLAASLDGLT